MKWKKFQELQHKHPFLERGIRRYHPVGADSKEFVRTKVNYIAFRPFESLDLSAQESSSTTPLKSNYVHVRMEAYTSIHYQLDFHVEDEAESTRGRYVANDVGDGSIQTHIDQITAWFDSCEAFQGKQLIWERVIKMAASGSSHTGLSSMSLEIYLFPLHYRFKPMVRAIPSAVNPAHIAYVAGTSLPPIIPGQTLVAG